MRSRPESVRRCTTCVAVSCWRPVVCSRLRTGERYAAARILRLLGRSDEASQQLEAVVRDEPGHADACVELARLLAESGDDPDRGVRLAQRAVRIEPGPASQEVLGFARSRARAVDPPR